MWTGMYMPALYVGGRGFVLARLPAREESGILLAGLGGGWFSAFGSQNFLLAREESGPCTRLPAREELLFSFLPS